MKNIKFWRAFQEGLEEEMDRDETIIYLGEDAGGKVGGPFALAKGLQFKYPTRVFDTPDSEAAYIGVGIGLAINGYRPVLDISFMDFMFPALDMIVNHAAKLRYMAGGENIKKIPMVIHTMAGAGKRAGAQHSACFESWFANIPGLKVVCPSNPYDVKGIIKSAIRDDNPVIVMKHKFILGMPGQVPEGGEHLIPIGKAFVKREGTDVTLVAISHMVNVALEAAEKLHKEDGISVEVIDPLTVSPLDKQTIIDSVKKTGRLVTVHEQWLPCGMGAEIGSIVFEGCFDYLQAPLVRVGASFNPMAYSPGLEDASIPNVPKIMEAVKTSVRS